MISRRHPGHLSALIGNAFRFDASGKAALLALPKTGPSVCRASSRRAYAWLAALVLTLTLPSSPRVSASDSPLVAAASGTRFALREIVDSFKSHTGIEVRLTLASSGKLYRQVENGAPFEIFLSADASLTQRLAAMGLTRGEPVDYARGRLAIVVPGGSPIEPDSALQGLEQSLDRGQISRFSIANPEHAPYGRRAREALQAAGLWRRLQGKLVIGENVAQAMQFALSGAAQGGMVARSLLVPGKTPGAAEYRYALLPEAWHRPLLHSMVLLKNADRTTMQFFHYLQSPRARQILSRYGYTPSF